MIGIFLITHGTLGESLIQCVCHVMGKRPAQLVQLGVTPQDDPAELLSIAQQMLSWADSGEGVVILTDIFGATPSNIASKLGRTDYVECVSGVNLPMLLRILTYRDKDMKTLLRCAVSGGCDGIMHARRDADDNR